MSSFELRHIGNFISEKKYTDSKHRDLDLMGFLLIAIYFTDLALLEICKKTNKFIDNILVTIFYLLQQCFIKIAF